MLYAGDAEEEDAAYALQSEFHGWRRQMGMEPSCKHRRTLNRWAALAGFYGGVVLPLEGRDIG